MFLPRLMLMRLVCEVKSTTKAGADESDKTPVPKTPLTGSSKVKGFAKVAPELKLRDTLIVAGNAITETHLTTYQLNWQNLKDLSLTIRFLFVLPSQHPRLRFRHC